MFRRPLLSAFFVAAACFMPSVAQTVDADSLRAALMAEEMAMNAPGRMAADFRLMLADGAESRLSHFRGAPLLLVLFDPDCDDCLRALDKLPEKVPHGMAVLAVYADGDMSVWPRALVAVPQDWTAALDLDGVYSSGMYSPEFTPGIYLLDAEGRVIARGADAFSSSGGKRVP